MLSTSFRIYGVPTIGIVYCLLTLSIYHTVRDTWERDHYQRIVSLAEQAEDFAKRGDLEGASTASSELLEIVKDRQLESRQLAKLVEEAKQRVAECKEAMLAQAEEESGKTSTRPAPSRPRVRRDYGRSSSSLASSRDSGSIPAASGSEAREGSINSEGGREGPVRPQELPSGGSAGSIAEQQANEKEVALEAEKRKERELLLAEVASEMSKLSVVEVQTRTVTVQKVISEKREYFKNFNTPVSSQFEHDFRMASVMKEYPYEDEGGRRYRVVKETRPERIQRKVLMCEIKVPQKDLNLGNVLLIVTGRDLLPDTLEEIAESDFALTTGPIKSGKSYSKEISCDESKLGEVHAYLLLATQGASPSYAIVKVQGEAVGLEEPKAAKLLSSFFEGVEKAEAAARERSANNWMQNRDEVARRYVATLISSGEVISAAAGVREAGNFLSYEFTFETDGGFIRKYRNGFVYLEQSGQCWVVRKVCIDGIPRPAYWPREADAAAYSQATGQEAAVPAKRPRPTTNEGINKWIEETEAALKERIREFSSAKIAADDAAKAYSDAVRWIGIYDRRIESTNVRRRTISSSSEAGRKEIEKLSGEIRRDAASKSALQAKLSSLQSEAARTASVLENAEGALKDAEADVKEARSKD